MVPHSPQDQTLHSNQDLWVRERRERRERASRCRTEWGHGRKDKSNPGNRYRKRLEPVLPGRLDLRSRRDAITERRGKVPTEERKEGSKSGRERGDAKRSQHGLLMCVCYSPSHPPPVPEQRSSSQQHQQQQEQHRDHYGGCAYTHTRTHTHTRKHKHKHTQGAWRTDKVILNHIKKKKKAVDSRPPEPEPLSLWATDSQRCPAQPDEHLHTHKRGDTEVCVSGYTQRYTQRELQPRWTQWAPDLHSGRRVVGLMEHWPFAQYSLVSHV